MRTYLKSKIHKATITEANLNYVGSLTIDRELMDDADIDENEQVHVVNNTRGTRIITYVIEGERGSGIMCANGAAAHLMEEGDEIIVMTYEHCDEPKKPLNVLVDENNKFVRYLEKEVN
jgi:aspartate 1-decarboxylase